MSSAMTDTDRLAVVELLRELARSRHPTAQRPNAPEHRHPSPSGGG